jgi:hypothetical protein
MRELHKTYAEAARFGVKGWRIVSHLEQLQRYGGCPGMVTCPQPIHKYHSPSDLAFINLKFSPSVQYGHRIGFGIFNLVGSDGILLRGRSFAEFPPALLAPLRESRIAPPDRIVGTSAHPAVAGNRTRIPLRHAIDSMVRFSTLQNSEAQAPKGSTL